MKIQHIIILLLAFTFSFVRGEKDEVDLGKLKPDVVLKAIDHFINDPTSEESGACAAIIVGFAEESDDVKLIIDMNVIPWLKIEGLPDSSSALLAAYVGGNVKAQLKAGKKVDSPKSGIEAVIKVYKKMRAKGKLPKIKPLEEWVSQPLEKTMKSIEAARKKDAKKK